MASSWNSAREPSSSPNIRAASITSCGRFPWGSLSYRIGDRYIEISGPSLRANLLGGGRFEFGPILATEMGRDDDIDNPVVRRLGRIKSATMAGAFFSTDFDLGKGSAIQIGAEMTADIGNTNKGKVAKFEIGYRRQLGEKWMVMTGLSTSWVDRNYMQTYFGVTPSGAATSRLPIYTAKSGFEHFELSSGLYRRLSPRLSAAPSRPLRGGVDRNRHLWRRKCCGDKFALGLNGRPRSRELTAMEVDHRWWRRLRNTCSQ
jgi:MipA family protein